MNTPRYIDQDETDRVINFGMRSLIPGRAYVVLYVSREDQSGCEIKVASNLDAKQSQDMLTQVAAQLGLLNNSPNN